MMMMMMMNNNMKKNVAGYLFSLCDAAKNAPRNGLATMQVRDASQSAPHCIATIKDQSLFQLHA